jgi:uncharacterized protein Smg (DUF494 family)
VSARSRALADLAAHFTALAQTTQEWGFEPPEIYSATDMWERAADMARRTAESERWRERIARRLHLPWP